MAILRELTSGRGSDAAIEAAGHNVTMRQALEASRPGGRVVILGKTAIGQEVSFQFTSLMGEREIVRTSYGMSRPRQDFPRLADLAMRGELHLAEMITMRLPLADINRGFAELQQGNLARAVVVFDSWASGLNRCRCTSRRGRRLQGKHRPRSSRAARLIDSLAACAEVSRRL